MTRKKDDLTGKRFGKLIVVRLHSTCANGKSLWECVCDCGRDVKIRRDHLTGAKISSCGCIREYLDGGEGRGMTYLWKTYTRRATQYNIEFTLSKEEFFYLTSQSCYYCDSPPSRIAPSPSEVRYRNYIGGYTYNGIDRIDSTKGYTIGNTRSCCKQCNWAKNNFTEREFYTWAKRIATHIAHWDISKEED